MCELDIKMHETALRNTSQIPVTMNPVYVNYYIETHTAVTLH